MRGEKSREKKVEWCGLGEKQEGRKEQHEQAKARELWVLCVSRKAFGKINIEDYFVVCLTQWNLVSFFSIPPACYLLDEQREKDQKKFWIPNDSVKI